MGRNITTILVFSVVALAAILIIAGAVTNDSPDKPRTLDDVLFWPMLILGSGFGAAVGYLAGKPVGQERKGFVLGGLLSILGWILILFASDRRPVCPFCKGRMAEGVTKCMHCVTELV